MLIKSGTGPPSDAGSDNSVILPLRPDSDANQP